MTRMSRKLFDMNKQHFLLAVSFLTRVPVHFKQEIEDNALSEASGYFALVGLLLGFALAVIFGVASLILPPSVCVILTLALGILITGAFHEDGFADVWDGFGGGWTVSQKLSIMKDSRLGTYGASALILLLLLKFQLLSLLSDSSTQVLCALVLGHTLSRAVATSIIGKLAYVQEDAQSKVKPVAMSLSSHAKDFLALTSLCVLFVLWLFTPLSLMSVIILVAVLFLTRQLCISWFKQQLGGYTGDCLGAAQQCCEIMIYLTLVALWV